MKGILKHGKWMLALGILIALVAAAQVALSHMRYELTKDNTTLRHERKELVAELNRLSLELASLTRPERIRRLAKSRLGMGPPTPMQVIRP